MKICVRGSAKITGAPAIKVESGQNLIELRKKNPNATLFVPEEDYQEELTENIYYIVKDISRRPSFPFIYYYAVNTFEDIHRLIALGASYIRITSPLTFQLNKLKGFAEKVKFIMAHDDKDTQHLPLSNFPRTHFVRPEDLKLYEEVIDILDISDETPSRCEALYRIYSEERWSGPLNLLFPEAPGYIDNSLILDNFGERRSNCGLRCLEEFSPKCKYCQLALSFPSLKNRIEKNK